MNGSESFLCFYYDRMNRNIESDEIRIIQSSIEIYNAIKGILKYNDQMQVNVVFQEFLLKKF